MKNQHEELPRGEIVSRTAARVLEQALQSPPTDEERKFFTRKP